MEEESGMVVWVRRRRDALSGAGAVRRSSPNTSGHTTTPPSSIEKEGFSGFPNHLMAMFGKRAYGTQGRRSSA